MTLVSPQQFADNTVHTAAQHNDPNNEMANAINGGLENENIAANAAIDPSKIAGLTAAAFSAGAAWTPTWTNLTVGNGTVVARYIQQGKKVFFTLKLTWGSTTSISAVDPRFTLPVTSVSDYHQFGPIGPATLIDTSAGANAIGTVGWYSTTAAVLNVSQASGTYVAIAGINATTPWTWATGDVMFCLGEYEAA